MGKFKVGDKVIVIAHNKEMENPYIGGYINKELYNLVGVICAENAETFSNGTYSYGVDFKENINGHNCNGSCKDGYGQNINEKYLEPYDSSYGHITINDYLDNWKTNIFKCITKKENKTMQKEKYEMMEKATLQIKERYSKKRSNLVGKIGLSYAYDNKCFLPTNSYFNSNSQTTILEFDNDTKFISRPTAGDVYNEDLAFEIIAAKRIYSWYSMPFDTDMSSLETKVTAKCLLHNGKDIAFSRYVSFLKEMAKTFNDEKTELKKAKEKIRQEEKAEAKEKKEAVRKEKEERKNELTFAFIKALSSVDLKTNDEISDQLVSVLKEINTNLEEIKAAMKQTTGESDVE